MLAIYKPSHYILCSHLLSHNLHQHSTTRPRAYHVAARAEGLMGKVSATIASEIMVFVVVILFIIFVVIFFLYLHAKRYHDANPVTTTRTSQLRFVLAPPGHPHPHRGLNPAVLSCLPVTIFNASKDTPLECSVCLCELSDGEKARVLPSCGHGFHVQCIDMWFHSNSTCPLCRTLVSERRPSVRGLDTEGSSSPALTWKREGMLVIEIPRRVLDLAGSPSASSPLPLSLHAATQSPLSARLRSLRRMLSGRSMVVGAECTCSSEVLIWCSYCEI